MTVQKSEVQRDAMGNIIDPEVQYARGSILRSSEDEVLRQERGFAFISRWVKEHGLSSVYNLNGVVRANRVEGEDLNKLGFFESIAHVHGKAEQAALEFLGGDRRDYSAAVTSRVSAANMVAMLGLIRRGSQVISVTPDGRAHPSLKLGVTLAGGNFVALRSGVGDLEEAVVNAPEDTLVVITTVTPQIQALKLEDIKEAVRIAKEHGRRVYLEDAHAAFRMAAFDQPSPIELGADVTAFSCDKHIFGPRVGVIVGRRELISRIRSKMFQVGCEAQSPQLVGVRRALFTHEDGHIKRSLKVAQDLHRRLEQIYGSVAYISGNCVAVDDANVMKVLMEAAQVESTRLVPQEACSAISMLMLERYGIVTVAAMASPGAAPYLRLIMWPDGERLGVDRTLEATQYAVEIVSENLGDLDKIKAMILG